MADLFTSYIKTELLALVPLLWLCGQAIKKTHIQHSFIPFILGFIGVGLACLYVFSTCEVYCLQSVLYCLFAGITQGLLSAGASVYTNEIIKIVRGKRSDDE